MNLPIWALRLGAFFMWIVEIGALRCYDSDDPEPNTISECRSDQEVSFYFLRLFLSKRL